MRINHRWTWVWMVGLAALACSKDAAGPTVCGAQTCNDRQVCATDSAAGCVCREQYAGADCSSCAAGYTAGAGGACTATAISCADASPCGPHGTCMAGTGGDACNCEPGYAGRACQTCAVGYQDNDRDGVCTTSCASTSCTAAQTCSDSSGTAHCACPGNHTGPSCDHCPVGWTPRPADNVCVQGCTLGGSGCGVRKTCDPSLGVCVCQAGYSGDQCDGCATGYQDNNHDGTCTAGCAMMTCPTGQSCNDSSGTARCACPADRMGTNCEQCLAGWVMRPSDGSCVQTCATLTCSARRTCEETQGAATCACQPGYAGPNCTACAAGYFPVGSGQCAREAPAGTTLLGAGTVGGGEYLLALDPIAGTATPLRPEAGLSGMRLAADLLHGRVFAATSAAVGDLDLFTGVLTPLARLESTGALTFGSKALWTLGSATPTVLERIDVINGAIIHAGPANPPVGSLAWPGDGATVLLARPPTAGTNGADLDSIDLGTVAVTPIGPLVDDGTGLRPADTRVGLSFDADGRLFLVTHLGRSAEAVVTDHCRKTAAGLGYTGYDDAPITSLVVTYDGIGAGQTRVLTARGGSGKEILAYASYGHRAAGKATVQVQSANPDAFVCLSTYEEVLELQLAPATARYTAIAVAGYRPTLTLVVDGPVPAVTRPTLHVCAPNGTVAPAFNGANGGQPFSRVYSASQWSALRLPSYAGAWDSDTGAASVLIEVDLATRMRKRVVSFPGVELFPTLAPWSP
jgi:hypothetical protein